MDVFVEMQPESDVSEVSGLEDDGSGMKVNAVSGFENGDPEMDDSPYAGVSELGVAR